MLTLDSFTVQVCHTRGDAVIPRVAMISTYPPTRCGVAQYSRSLATAMSRLGQEVGIVRIGGNSTTVPDPAVLADYRSPADLGNALRALNRSDVVLLQHDFAMYPGQDGVGVVDFIAGLRVPLITVLHSVPVVPSDSQRRIVQRLVDTSDVVVLLSASARKILSKGYDADPSRLFHIPIGAPSVPQSFRSPNLHMRPRILSWGLLRPGKGLEWGIAALSEMQDLEPMPDYFIVGQTHPRTLQREGLAYRRQLEQLAVDLGVDDRVHFIDEYLDMSTLINTRASADIHMLPFDAYDLSSSAVLVEALATGAPVISTRFPHAVELLGDGTGLLVNSRDPQALAAAVRSVVRDVDGRERMNRQSLYKMRNHAWPTVGAKFVSLVQRVAAGRDSRHSGDSQVPVAAAVPMGAGSR